MSTFVRLDFLVRKINQMINFQFAIINFINSIIGNADNAFIYPEFTRFFTFF